MIIDTNLWKHQHDILRDQVNSIIPNLYPSYKTAKQVNRRRYPHVSITENSAEIPLQSLFEFREQSLCEAQ